MASQTGVRQHTDLGEFVQQVAFFAKHTSKYADSRFERGIKSIQVDVDAALFSKGSAGSTYKISATARKVYDPKIRAPITISQYVDTFNHEHQDGKFNASREAAAFVSDALAPKLTTYGIEGKAEGAIFEIPIPLTQQ